VRDEKLRLGAGNKLQLAFNPFESFFGIHGSHPTPRKHFSIPFFPRVTGLKLDVSRDRELFQQ
jgi:hypothetical protein